MTAHRHGVVASIARRLGPRGRPVVLLASGAGAAQLAPILAAPILTRLYAPADYGAVAVFGAVAAILAAIAAGRYHLAVMLSTDDAEATNIVALALVVATAFSVALGLVVFAFHGELKSHHGFASLGVWLYALPVVVLLGSGFDTLTYLALRRDRHTDCARANALRAFTGAGAQIGLGAAGAGVAGLVLGSVLSLAAACGLLVGGFRSLVRVARPAWASMRASARRHVNFLLYDVWSTLANVLSYNITMFGIGLFYGPVTAGHYALALRLLALPSALLGTAVGQVYFREATRRIQEGRSAMRAFDKVAVTLAAASVGPFVVLIVVSEDLFSFVFGSAWRGSGVLAGALIPLVWARFVSSPLSTAFLVHGRQRLLLGWQVAMLTTTLTSFSFAYWLEWSAWHLLSVQSAALSVVCGCLLLHARKVVREADHERGGMPPAR